MRMVELALSLVVALLPSMVAQLLQLLIQHLKPVRSEIQELLFLVPQSSMTKIVNIQQWILYKLLLALMHNYKAPMKIFQLSVMKKIQI